VDAQVAADGAEEVGDQARCGQDAERLEPQADDDAGGARDLEPGQDGQVLRGNVDGAGDDGQDLLVLAELELRCSGTWRRAER